MPAKKVIPNAEEKDQVAYLIRGISQNTFLNNHEQQVLYNEYLEADPSKRLDILTGVYQTSKAKSLIYAEILKNKLNK
jgi:hypothetical protein